MEGSGTGTQSNIDSDPTPTFLWIYALDCQYSPNSTWLMSRLDRTRHVRRVEPVHSGSVELVEQHGSMRSSRRAQSVERVVSYRLSRRDVTSTSQVKFWLICLLPVGAALVGVDTQLPVFVPDWTIRRALTSRDAGATCRIYIRVRRTGACYFCATVCPLLVPITLIYNKYVTCTINAGAGNYLPLSQGGVHPLKLFDTPTPQHRPPLEVLRILTRNPGRVYAILSYRRLLQKSRLL